MDNINNLDESNDLKNEALKYLFYWPYFLASLIFGLSLALIYLRYADYQFQVESKIEIVDEAQDSEMALPTAMTVFNRSMINLENEMGVLNSYKLHEKVVEELNAFITYSTVGNIKTTQNKFDEFYDDFTIEYTYTDYEKYVDHYFEFEIKSKILSIDHYDQNNELLNSYNFSSLNTNSKQHELPFEINILNNSSKDLKIIRFNDKRSTVNSFLSRVTVNRAGKESDQLVLRVVHPNKGLGNDYMSTLLSEFDNDGILDRQLEYKRTIDFVDSRSVFLKKELSQVEIKKQEFKEKNNLNDIKSDAQINITQKLTYDSELFQAQSQKDLTALVKSSIRESEYSLMPVDIGIQNTSINLLISEYNLAVNERQRFLSSVGANNIVIKNAENQIRDLKNNILISLENYEKKLEKSISNLENKEKEYELLNRNLPEKEKILRSIERELEVKESLFLLLLQKREEAAINFAVIKPSIKIIDNPQVSLQPVSPNILLVLLGSVITSLLFPFFVLYFKFFFDNKIHTRLDLQKNIDDIPIIGEVPFIEDKNNLKMFGKESLRSSLAESVRMILANLNFILFNESSRNEKNNLILVTSSIKGEGKTLISTNLASSLSNKSDKVLLIGADLRNPQIHKFIGKQKSDAGLTNYLMDSKANWKNFVIKKQEIDIILSGSIPPNPTELLASKKFKNFIEEIKSLYDYVVIDSAPCILVSDTFEISKYVDTTVYVVRAHFTPTNLYEFMNECKVQKKLSNIGLVLNGIGKKSAYGAYSYGYSYAYKYRYNYNYGYGYGYSDDKK